MILWCKKNTNKIFFKYLIHQQRNEVWMNLHIYDLKVWCISLFSRSIMKQLIYMCFSFLCSLAFLIVEQYWHSLHNLKLDSPPLVCALLFFQGPILDIRARNYWQFFLVISIFTIQCNIIRMKVSFAGRVIISLLKLTFVYCPLRDVWITTVTIIS